MKSIYDETTVLGTLVELEKIIPYHTSYSLVAISIKQKESTWLLVITVKDQVDNRLVAFIRSNSIYHCLELLTTALHSRSYTLKWHKDRFNS